MIETDRFRERLLDERRRVLAALENLHAENPGSLEDETGELTSSSSNDNHMADTATETFDRELADTLEDNSEAVLTAIDGALRRIDDGTYGTCVRCGKPIAPERLEALPYAELCIDCKRDAERYCANGGRRGRPAAHPRSASVPPGTGSSRSPSAPSRPAPRTGPRSASWARPPSRPTS